MSETESRPWERIADLTELGDRAALESAVAGLPQGEAARVVSRLPAELQARLLQLLEPERAAELIDQIPEVQAAALLEQLSPAQAATILHALPSDEQADLIGALPDLEAEALLAEMEPDEASDARRLVSYPPDVAGGLMVTEYLAYPVSASVADVLSDMRTHSERYSEYDVQYVYVVSDGTPTGVLRLRDLLLAPGGQPVSALMILDPLTVADDAPLDELADFFDAHAYFGVPVLDRSRKLSGVVRRHDVEEALASRAGADYLKSQGIVGGEELRTMPVFTRSRRRLSWLSINILLNGVAASVIALYQETLQSVIALAVFLPIISDMSGCSGNQAVAVSMRELTLGVIKPVDALRVWWSEARVGVINGLALGLLIAIAAFAWKGSGYLGLVVGGALALNTLLAVSIGGTVPLLLRRIGVDPALASGPVLTTVTDMCGFFLVLSFATAMLPMLVDL
jgi:magnesium transporter